MPVRNNVRRNAESVGNHAIAPKGFDQFRNHASISQIVTLRASENITICAWKVPAFGRIL